MDILHTATSYHSGNKTVGLLVGPGTPSSTADAHVVATEE